MYDNMNDVTEEYGCVLSKFISPNTLNKIIENFNRIVLVDNIKYVSCKDDAGIFVLVTNRYVIKIYNEKTYIKLVNIYNKLWSVNQGNIFDHIEKIYYYFSIVNGIIIHDTYFNNIMNEGTGHLTINELLVPLFPQFNKSNITWDYSNTKKLLIDVSLGLIELHKLNIIHGDSTPDNIGLRESDNNFVLYDFGDAHDGFNYRDDVNRFLNSILITYKTFFNDYIGKIEKIKAMVNHNKNYDIYDFYNTINKVFLT